MMTNITSLILRLFPLGGSRRGALALLLLFPLLCIGQTRAVFDYANYTAAEADEKLMPLGGGCAPDPTILRVGDDYYLANSSFSYYPGVPIWHSTDLKHWKRLGYVLNRPSQLMLKDGIKMREGVYAPHLSYNPATKTYYMISTLIAGGGTFYVTTTDPKSGNWSDPVWLKDIDGIDPSFFFDDNGKAYVLHNAWRDQHWKSHCDIWCKPFDPQTGQTFGEERLIVYGGADTLSHPQWLEGPHMYKVGHRYIVMCAEGGTGENHSVVVFEGSDPMGRFTPCAINPILTQRDVEGAPMTPVTCTGHADLVETKGGDWYAVFLGVRPYEKNYDLMGRETFMLPVKWVTPDGKNARPAEPHAQPLILEKGKKLTPKDGKDELRTLWDKNGIAPDAFTIRTPMDLRTPFANADNGPVGVDAIVSKDGRGVFSLKKNALTIVASEKGVEDKTSPAAIGQWVTQSKFTYETRVTFDPKDENSLAGIVLFYDDQRYMQFGVSADSDGSPCLRIKASLGDFQVNSHNWKIKTTKEVRLRAVVDGKGHVYFSFLIGGGAAWRNVGMPLSLTQLTSKEANGFTGLMVGLFARE